MKPLGESCVTVQVEVHPLKEMIPVRDAITAPLNDLDLALIITSASSLMPPRASNKVAGLGAVDVGAVLAVEKRAR